MKIKILIFSLLFSALYAGVVNAQLRTFTSEQVGGTPLNGYILQTNGATSTWVATSSLGISVAESDPVWSAFLLNPIFTNLTSTNFFATNTLFINASSTNLFATSLTFTDTVGTNLTVDNLTSTLTASFANDKIHIDSNTATVFALATENALGSYFSTGVLSDFWGVFSDTAYLGSYFDQDGNTAGIPMQIRYGKGNDTGNAILIDGVANTMEVPLDTTFLSGLNFVNATGTNLFATSSNLIGLIFTNASGTTLTSTNSYFNNVYINTTTQLATVSLQGVPTLDLVKAVSSSGAQLFAIKSNGQVVVGPNDLAQTGALTIQTQTGNDKALSFTDGVNYTFELGRVAGTSGQAYIGGPFGTSLNLRAGGTDRVFILNTNGYVGINSTTPSTQFVVVGTSTFNGLIDFTTASGTSITSTNAFFTNLTVSGPATFVDEVTFQSSMFGTSLTLDNTLTTQNLGVNVSSVFDGDASFIGNTVQFSGGLSSTAITTTELYIAGMLKDWTGSPGNSGDIFVSTGTSTIWKDSAACDPLTTDCTLMDYNSYFIVTGATGCPEGYILYKDDSTYTCSPDVQWMYYLDPKVFSVNGTISSTDLVAQGTITTTNLVVLGSFSVDDLSVNNLTAITSTLQNVYVSTTLVLYSATGTAAQMFIYGLPDNQTIASLNDVNDPGLLQIGTALANHMAIYSDDITRILEFASSSGGSVSLRNENLSPNNTGASAIYDMSGVLQTITVTSLFGNGYIFRGCITSEGYHYCMAASSTGTYIKRVTSSPSVSIATPSNWSTSTISGFTLNASMPGIVGVNYLGQIMILSSTTYFQPMAVTKSSNTLTATGGNTLASAACNLVTCRVNYTGFWARNSSAPYMTHYDNNGTIINTYQRGQSDPSLTGPTVFVTKYSLYLFLVDALFKQRI